MASDTVLRSREAYKVAFNLFEAARRRGDQVYLVTENCANQLLAA